MKGMQSLMIMMSKLMPEEELIDQLQESLTDYKLTKSEMSKQKLSLFSLMLATRLGTEKTDTVDLINQLDKDHEAIGLLRDRTS